MIDSVICPYCENIYEFTKETFVPAYTICPFCGKEVIIRDEDLAEDFYKEIYSKPRAEKRGTLIKIFVCFVIIVFVSLYFILVNTDILTEEARSINEPNTPNIVESGPEFMEGIGYEFTDTREPTNEELFATEESLNLCYNPTYSEVISFIEEDETNYYEWIEGEFMCGDFSLYVVVNARQEKMRCGFVTIYPVEDEYAEELYKDNPPHAIVVFNTIDKGLIFIEPSLDDIFTYNEFIEMRANNHYYAENEWYEIEMDFDHYVIDWFYWYLGFEVMQTWNLYKAEYPDFKASYDEYFTYNEV